MIAAHSESLKAKYVNALHERSSNDDAHLKVLRGWIKGVDKGDDGMKVSADVCQG